MIRYRREIDGLRALAVLPVILFHAGFEAFGGGFVGVDVFFVISGYLITSIILAEKEAGTFSIVSFYERRARRILPALFFVMAACIPFAWLWLLPEDMSSFGKSLIAVPLFVSNHLFYGQSGYFDTAAELKPLLHTWSLAVEEQYYVLFPLFIMLTWRLGKRWMIGLLAGIAISSFALAQWNSYNNPSAAFFLLPARGWELAIGAFIAFYFAKPDRLALSDTLGECAGLAGLVLILYAVFVFNETTPFPGLYALVPTFGAALLILFSTQNTVVGRVLGTKAFAGIGLISYSAYLWHQPLFAFARHKSLVDPSDLFMAGLSLFALILGFFSWLLIERPFRNRRIFSRKTIFVIALIFSSFLIVFGFSIYSNAGYADRLSPALKNISAESANKSRYSDCRSGDKKIVPLENACVIGNKSNARVALLGDSHAYAISESLEKLLLKENLGFKMFTHDGCPLVPGLHQNSEKKKRLNECHLYSQQVYDYIKRNNDYEYLVIIARWPLYVERERFDNKEGGIEKGGDAWLDIYTDGVKHSNPEELRKNLVLDKYVAMIKSYLDMNKKVVLFYAVPEAGWDVPRRLSRIFNVNNSFAPADASTSFELHKQRMARVNRAFDAIPENSNLIRIRPTSYLCDADVPFRCITHKNGVPLYYDDDHLSNSGAEFLLNKAFGEKGFENQFR